MNDEEIIKAICSTSQDQNRALLHLYRYKGAEFKRFFYSKGFPFDSKGATHVISCEDLLQETVLYIFKGAKNFRGSGGISENSANAWMWAIARNCLNDHLRQKQKDSIVINDSGGETEREPYSTEIKSLIQEASERRTQLEIDLCVSNGIENFCASHPDRALVLMMQMDGENIESIARRIGRTIGATKEYISQCKIKIRPYVENCLEFVSV